MIDDSYTAALERSGPRHEVILGPLPCKGCGAWVEWAGVDWLAVATQERHECAPFLGTWREHMQRQFAKMQAHPMTEAERPAAWEHQRALPPPSTLERRATYLALILLGLAVVVLTSGWAR